VGQDGPRPAPAGDERSLDGRGVPPVPDHEAAGAQVDRAPGLQRQRPPREGVPHLVHGDLAAEQRGRDAEDVGSLVADPGGDLGGARPRLVVQGAQHGRRDELGTPGQLRGQVARGAAAQDDGVDQPVPTPVAAVAGHVQVAAAAAEPQRPVAEVPHGREHAVRRHRTPQQRGGRAGGPREHHGPGVDLETVPAAVAASHGPPAARRRHALHPAAGADAAGGQGCRDRVGEGLHPADRQPGGAQHPRGHERAEEQVDVAAGGGALGVGEGPGEEGLHHLPAQRTGQPGGVERGVPADVRRRLQPGHRGEDGAGHEPGEPEDVTGRQQARAQQRRQRVGPADRGRRAASGSAAGRG
jgi:hypothetical protein